MYCIYKETERYNNDLIRHYNGNIRVKSLEGIHGEYLGKMVFDKRCSDEENAAKETIFWIFGGAFFAGNVDGNIPIAAHYGRETGKNVMIVNYKLCPEGTIENASDEVINAYEWLLASDYVDSAADVSVLGISSGAGLAVKLMQHIHANKEDFDNEQPSR